MLYFYWILKKPGKKEYQAGVIVVMDRGEENPQESEDTGSGSTKRLQ